jgi:L-ascorbate metabolism protein UlaG (beta-lactamase superfamily)
MKIKKLAHCCLFIETNGLKILTDPGIYSLEGHDSIGALDIILITHEHEDHFHINSVKALIARIPNVKIIANDAVGEILSQHGIVHHIMKDGQEFVHKDLLIQARGKLHARIHSTIPQISNVGFILKSDKTVFIPGDAFTKISEKIDILALPVSGSWMKIEEAIDYAIEMNPKIAFPIHDSVRFASEHNIPKQVLSQYGIDFIALKENESVEI